MKTTLRIVSICLITALILIKVEIAKAQYPTTDYSGMDLGYVGLYGVMSTSVMYDYSFSSVNYPACQPKDANPGSIVVDTNVFRCGTQSGCFPPTIVPFGIGGFGGWEYFKESCIKKVYYGDTDAGVMLYEADVVDQASLKNIDFYVFSPYEPLDEGRYFFANGGTLQSYITKRVKKKMGYKVVAADGTLAKYNYVFRVSDWSSNSFLGSLEYSITTPYEELKRLNQGVEVYISARGVGKWKAWQDNKYYWAENGHTYARTIVYPKKPVWKTVSVPSKICLGNTYDLRTWVDMKGLSFSGKFAIISGGTELLENGYTLNTNNISGLGEGKEVVIRCYPFYKEGITSAYYQDGDWNVYMDLKVYIVPNTPLIDNGAQLICSNGGSKALTRVTPAGGTYTGSYISSSTLNVSNAISAGVTSIAVNYTYVNGDGCSSSLPYTQVITVAPTVTFSLPTTTCKNTPINLNTIVTPAGGGFSGTGVDGGGYFKPADVGVGTYALKYSVSGSCPVEQNKSIQVLDLLPETVTVTSIPKQCRDGALIDLMTYVSTSGGTFSGSGIQGGRYFNPATASVGMNTITYTLGSGSCQMNTQFQIEVAAAVVVTFGTMPTFCQAKEISLDSYVNIQGGTFSGVGVSNGKFNTAVAGVGTSTIYYNITSGGCAGSAQTNVTVKALLPALVDNGAELICSNTSTKLLGRYLPVGGAYTGSYISSSILNVSNAVAGGVTNIPVTYTLSENGCNVTAVYDQVITVAPTIAFNLPATTCKVTEINLANITTPKGGVFSGIGVNASGNFSPITSGVGTIAIKYSVSGTCPAEQTKNIQVLDLLPESITVNAIPKQCRDGAIIDLLNFVSTIGGTFSGSGIQGSRYFNPATATIGMNTITYTLGSGSCQMTKQFQIEVANSIAVSFGSIPTFCEVKEINLENFVSVSGGTFSGAGVNNGKFNSGNSGVGTFTIFYTVSSGGCAGTASTTVTVNSLLPTSVSFNTLPKSCKSDINGFYDLRGYVNNYISSGTFSGSGVENNFFNPSQANTGNNVIYYNYGGGVCARTVSTETTVYDGDNVTFLNIPTICKETTIDLMQYVSPQWGEFVGVGVTGKRYFNSGITGVGTFTITYRYFNGNCYTEVSKDIKVDGIIPENITFNEISDRCKSGNIVNLRENVNTSLGVFSGNGVVDEYFNPSQAVVGMNLLKLTIQEGNCKSVITQNVNVKANPSIIINDIGEVCSQQKLFLGNLAYPAGGLFTGNGIEGMYFNPLTAGVGDNYIYYTVTGDGGCSGIATKKITVKGLLPETVNFYNVPDMCPGGEPINLIDYVEPKIGTFVGTGMVGSVFDPKISGSGTFMIKYTVTSGTCSIEKTKAIVVKTGLTVLFNTIADVCTDDTVKLVNYVYPSGGVFSGSGVVGNNFLPKVAGLGEKYVFYTASSNGCSVTKSVKVNIKAIIPTTWKLNTIPSLCKDADPIDLNSYIIGYSGVNGVFSGNGTVGSIFNPRVASEGGNVITYTITEGGCTSVKSKTVSVKPLPSVTFNSIPSVCSDEQIELTNYVFPSGGLFSGKGVNGSYLDPKSAGVGDNYVYYSVTGVNGCTTKAQDQVTINALIPSNVTFNPIPNVCRNGSTVNVRSYLNTTLGVISGKGIVGDYFNPQQGDIGANMITLTISSNGCSKSYQQTIVVENGTSVNVIPISIICNEGVIDLSTKVTPNGGLFTGEGISNTFFDPVVAGVGDHTIFYTVVSANGCSTVTEIPIKVNAIIPKTLTFSSLGSICLDSDPVNLRTYVSYDGGSFSGRGVVGDLFSPTQAGAGATNLTFSVVNNGCTVNAIQTVTVLNSPSITFNAIPTICNTNPIDLSNYVYPLGGTFSGSSVVGNTFTPSISNVGDNYINYSLSGANGCVSTRSSIVKVSAILPNAITFVISDTICNGDDPINLKGFVSYDGGVFSGKGVTGDVFDPVVAGVGVNGLTYTINKNSCIRIATTTVNVLSPPIITFSTIGDICSNKEIDLNTYVYPTGGSFSGDGVVFNKFIPEIMGEGQTNVYYTLKGKNGCVAAKDQVLKIKALIPFDLSFSSVESQCKRGELVNLRGYVNTSMGNFEGTGIEGDMFNPVSGAVGSNIISLKISANGCTAEKKQTIRVIDDSDVQFGDIPVICYKNTIDLNGYVSPSGGLFTGKGVLGTIFNPVTAGIGKHQVLYEYRGMAGCKTVLNKEIAVKNLYDSNQDITINAVPDLCLNSPDVDLRTYVGPSGGFFTGNGITGNLFSPQTAGIGNHQITYNVGNIECVQSKGFIIRVIGNGTVNIETVPTICGSDIELIGYVEPATGIFQGKYLSGSTFLGSVAPEGKTTIKYEVLTSEGCTVVKSIDIMNQKLPNVNLTVSEDNVQEGGIIQFIPVGLTSNYAMNWRFGDGGYSKEEQPWHYYYHTGSFDVSLILTSNTLGCSRTFTEAGLVRVETNGARKIYYKEKLIYDDSKTLGIKVFPNPFSDKLTLEGISEKDIIIINDVSGREIKRYKGESNLMLDDLKSGIYILTISGEKQYKFKIVKN